MVWMFFSADEVYDGLRSSLLATGKGRRPDIPHIAGITRRLLVQLFYLREEGGRTWTEVLMSLTRRSLFVREMQRFTSNF